jgi:hypothetical protein
MSEKSTPDTRLAPLEASAIPLAWAEETGIFWAEKADDLPPDLADYTFAVPGTIFPLRTISGAVVHQIRRETASKAANKYLLPKDHPPVLTVHPTHAERVGAVPRILIVEGTKQAIAASLYAPDDVLVAGIQGCWGWSRDGVAIPQMAELKVWDREVFVAFDADVATNRNVWDAAERLNDHLKSLKAKSVSWIKVPAGEKAGLDDFLASIPADQRSDVLDGLVINARPKLPRRPAKKAMPRRQTTAIEAVSDMAAGEIFRPEVTDPKSGAVLVPRTVLMPLAARIVSTVLTENEADPTANPSPQLDIEIAVPSADGTVSILRSNCQSSDLENLAKWLDTLPEGIGVSTYRPTSPGDRAAVVNAIRTCRSDETEIIKAWKRTGWVVADGVLHYLYAGGSIVPGGDDLSVRGDLPQTVSIIDFTGRGVYPEQRRSGAKASIDNLATLVNPTPWYALLGAVGLGALGPQPNAAVCLVGRQSTGKSGLLQTATAFLSPGFAYGRRLMGQIDGSTDVATDLYLNPHANSFALVDDIHPVSGRFLQEKQTNAVDMLLRRAHGASGRRRGKLDRDTGAVSEAPQSDTAPVVLLSMEPEVITNLANSGIDRMLTINVTRESTFKKDQFPAFAETGKDGRLAHAYAGYIRWLADVITTGAFDGAEQWLEGHGEKAWPTDAQSAFDSWCDVVAESRNHLASEIEEYVPKGTSTRATLVVSGLITGLGYWLSYCESTGAIDADEADHLFNEGAALLVKALCEHTNIQDDAVTTARRLVTEIKYGVLAGTLCIGETGKPGVTVVGRPYTYNTQDCVALFPTIYINRRTEKLSRSLRPLSIHDATDRGTIPVRIDGKVTRCVLITNDIWEGGDAASENSGTPTTTDIPPLARPVITLPPTGNSSGGTRLTKSTSPQFTVHQDGVDFRWLSPVRCIVQPYDKTGHPGVEKMLECGLWVPSGHDWGVAMVFAFALDDIPGFREVGHTDLAFVPPEIGVGPWEPVLDFPWHTISGARATFYLRTANYEENYANPPRNNRVVELAGGPILARDFNLVWFTGEDGWPVQCAHRPIDAVTGPLQVHGHTLNIDLSDERIDWENGWSIPRSDIPEPVLIPNPDIAKCRNALAPHPPSD